MTPGWWKQGRCAMLVGLMALGGCSGSLPPLGGFDPMALGLSQALPSSTSLLDGEPPITTSLSDATFGVDLADPPRGSLFRPLESLERTARGGFLLQPGLFEMHTQSYCLKAGTHGPGGGDGYLYGPPRGPAQEAVVALVRNSVQRAEIGQHDIQLLLWAIIARAKFENLSPELKLVAGRLLTPQQIAMLNRTALDFVPDAAKQSALASLPAPIRQVLQAEAQLRQMFNGAGSSFQQIEAVAVLAGVAPLGEGSKPVPAGRWSRHPDGYFVRYLPAAYSHTLTQLWVPDTVPARLEYDPALHIAVPGNTSRQRLIQSGRTHAR